MSKLFNNRKELKDFRRELRSNPTRAETEMWHGLRSKRLAGYKFRRQHSLGPFIVDFYCTQFQIVVEVDGATHDDLSQKEYDTERTKYLQENNIRVIRFTDGEVLWSVDMCCEKILALILEIQRKPEDEVQNTGSTTPTPP